MAAGNSARPKASTTCVKRPRPRGFPDGPIPAACHCPDSRPRPDTLRGGGSFWVSEASKRGSGGVATTSKPQESVIKSGDPGNAQNQSDSQGCLRTDAIKKPSEAEHDTGPCFSFLAPVSLRCARSTLTAVTFWRFAQEVTVSPAAIQCERNMRSNLRSWVGCLGGTSLQVGS
jgi:hypothetical protein